VDGKKGSNMVKALMWLLMESRREDYGIWGRGLSGLIRFFIINIFNFNEI
jgi:hypothetical protein